MAHTSSPNSARGFSLVEAMIAMSILLVGLLALAQVFCIGLTHLKTSSAHLVAREKAREAIESVHTARDSQAIAWVQVRNVNAPTCPNGTTAGSGGWFMNGERPLRAPGPDGLVNTSDDTGFEYSPGNDNILGTTDDIPLEYFWRQIDICDINDDLRRIRVRIRYQVGELERTYEIATLISSFS